MVPISFLSSSGYHFGPCLEAFAHAMLTRTILQPFPGPLCLLNLSFRPLLKYLSLEFPNLIWFPSWWAFDHCFWIPQFITLGIILSELEAPYEGGGQYPFLFTQKNAEPGPKPIYETFSLKRGRVWVSQRDFSATLQSLSHTRGVLCPLSHCSPSDCPGWPGASLRTLRV